MDGLGLPFIERLGHSGWLRLVAEVNAEIMVVDKVKTKRCNRLHTSDTQQISLKTKNCYK